MTDIISQNKQTEHDYLEKRNKFIEEFDEARRKYNAEHNALREKYGIKFNNILNNLKQFDEQHNKQ